MRGPATAGAVQAARRSRRESLSVNQRGGFFFAGRTLWTWRCSGTRRCGSDRSNPQRATVNVQTISPVGGWHRKGDLSFSVRVQRRPSGALDRFVADTDPFNPVQRGRKGVARVAAARVSTEKVLLDADAISRTLSRIAHELIEANPELDRLALVGIHTRGVPLAQRLRRLIAERTDEDVGARVARHHLLPRRRPGARRRGAAARAAARARDDARLPARGDDLRARRRRPLHGPHDPRGDRGAVRLRPPRARPARRASSTAATASFRSAPTTSARTFRPHAASASRCSSLEVDEVDRVLLVPTPEEEEEPLG